MTVRFFQDKTEEEASTGLICILYRNYLAILVFVFVVFVQIVEYGYEGLGLPNVVCQC